MEAWHHKHAAKVMVLALGRAVLSSASGCSCGGCGISRVGLGKTPVQRYGGIAQSFLFSCADDKMGVMSCATFSSQLLYIIYIYIFR